MAIFPLEELDDNKLKNLCSIYPNWEKCEFYKKRFDEERTPFRLDRKRKYI